MSIVSGIYKNSNLSTQLPLTNRHSIDGKQRMAKQFNSCQKDISFTGEPSIISKKVGKFAESFFKLAGDYLTVFEGVVALAVTTTIRPLTILATKKAEKRDKQYAAAQSIVSGGLGVITPILVLRHIKRGAQEITNPIKNFDKGSEKLDLIKRYKKVLKQADTTDDNVLEKLIESERKIVIDNYNKEVEKQNFINKYVKKKNQLPADLTEEYILDRAKKNVESNLFDIEKLLDSDGSLKKQAAIDLKVADISNVLSSGKKNVMEYIKNLQKGTINLVRENKVKVKQLDKDIVEALSKKWMKGTKGYEVFNYLFDYPMKTLIRPVEAMAMGALIPVVMMQLFPKHPKSSKGSKELQANYTPPLNNKYLNPATFATFLSKNGGEK